MDRDRAGLKTVQYKAFALNTLDLTAGSDSSIQNPSVFNMSILGGSPMDRNRVGLNNQNTAFA